MFVAINANSQWQPDVRLTNDTASSLASNNNAWCVASSGSVVHVVWYDNRDGNSEIYYKRSTDAGISWGTDTRLTNNTANSYDPSIVVSGSVVNIVWMDYRDGNWEIYNKRSTDAGISWGADTRLTNNTASSLTPSIAVSGSDIYVAWCESRDGNDEIYCKHSTDAGVSWGADTRLTNNPAISVSTSIAVSGSAVNVVWTDYRDNNSEIYYKRSTDAGVSWGSDTRMTNNNFDTYFPSVVVSGSSVIVVWQDDRDSNYEIYYKRSTDAGVSWSGDTRLTNNTAGSLTPSIIVSGLVFHVVWADNRDGNYEIYYKSSTDAGANWGADIRLTNNASFSGNPYVSVSGSVLHVVWQDNRDGTGNGEIYYKRNPTGNPIGIVKINSEVPSTYSISQNYPNPFNPTTNIKFNVAKLGDVKIVVYDLMGREVQTLLNESLKPGTYETSFDGSELNSGVYFYKMVTAGFTETKKMFLIK
jgi:hypothetical protein